MWLDVDAAGRVDPHQLERLLAERAAAAASATSPITSTAAALRWKACIAWTGT